MNQPSTNVLTLGAGIVLAAILVSLWFAPSRAIMAQEPREERTISVTGDADVNVVPDEVMLLSSVETWERDLQAAKVSNDGRVRRALDTARRFGVSDKDIQTDQITIYRRNRDSDTHVMGFAVRKSISIRLKEMSKFEGLLSALLEGGVNSIQGIDFRTTELRRHRDRARALALQAAREKAVAMSRELGQTIGLPQQIQEEPQFAGLGYGRYGINQMSQNFVQTVNGEAGESAETVAPGQIAVKARVQVVFLLR